MLETLQQDVAFVGSAASGSPPTLRRAGGKEIAREMVATAVWLGADDGNEAAHALYRSLGPHEVEPGVIYSYQIDPANDAHGSA